MIPPPPPPIAEGKKEIISKEETSFKKFSQETVRIRTEHLDKIMNLVGELVINKARIHQIALNYNITELTSVFGQLDKTITALQEEVLSTRMVPLRHIFDRYPRMVRDLAKKLDKEIEFEMEGSEIEVDRTLLDEINEPILHMLRNAIDHGIEPKEERVALGKPSCGKLKLKAKREKGYCIIEVSDDGKGMDVEEIRRKSLEKGIITQQQARELSEQEVLMLICHPSFSTAKQVSEVSGRGVGMDVVKKIVEKYNGRLEIITKKGQGSNFILYLPLTLAIIKCLLVKVGKHTYAIPITNVTEIVKLQPDNVKTIEEKGQVLILRDEVIPLLSLSRILNIEESEEVYVVVVELRDKKMGLVVSKMLGQQEVVVKTMGGVLKGIKNFSGATILGDGSVVLILDVGGLTYA